MCHPSAQEEFVENLRETIAEFFGEVSNATCMDVVIVIKDATTVRTTYVARGRLFVPCRKIGIIY
jgi:hypothetical protein